MIEYRNGPKSWARICLVITLIGLLMIYFPIVSEMDGLNGGFAMIFGGVVVTLTFFISTLVFYSQSRSLTKAIESKTTFARWTYTKDEWKNYYGLEYLRDKKEKRMLFYVASGFAIIFGILFLLIVGEPIGAIYACLGIIFLTAFLQWFTPWLNYKRNIKYAGTALISPFGVYLNGIWYPNNRFSRIENVRFIDKNKTLCFDMSQFAMLGGKIPGKNYVTVRVPVPVGEENTAQKVFEHFQT